MAMNNIFIDFPFFLYPSAISGFFLSDFARLIMAFNSKGSPALSAGANRQLPSVPQIDLLIAAPAA